MREYVFGSGQLYATDTNGNDPIKFGVLQDVSVGFSGDLKELHGQYGMPVAVGRGKQKIEVKAGNGDVDVNLYNSLYFAATAGSGGVVTTGSYAQAIDELGTPNASVASVTSTSITQTGGIATATFGSPPGFTVGQPITVTGAAPSGYNVSNEPVLSVVGSTITYAVPSSTTSPAGTQGSFVGAAAELEADNGGANFYRDLGVSYAASGIRLGWVPSTATPAVGQYKVSATGLYTFNVADEGTQMKVNYVYKVATGNTLTISNQLIGTEPTFQLLLAETFESQWLMMQLNAVKCGKLSQPLKLDDFSLADLEMSAFADNANNIGWIATSVGDPN